MITFKAPETDAAIEQLEYCIEHPGQPAGLPSGIPDLDFAAGRMKPGNLIMVVGRSGMGKTAFALSIVANVAQDLMAAEREARKAGVPYERKYVVVLSQEMNEQELIWRLASLLSEVPSKGIEWGHYYRDDRRIDLTPEDYRNFNRAILYVRTWPILWYCGPCTSNEMRDGLLALDVPVALVVDDYLGLHLDPEVSSEANRVNGISRNCKLIASRLAAPLILLHQLNRNADKREGNHAPIMSDLREGGEQDPDLILGLYRADYYAPTDKPKWVQKAECHIMKGRHSGNAVVPLTFHPSLTRYTPWVAK